MDENLRPVSTPEPPETVPPAVMETVDLIATFQEIRRLVKLLTPSLRDPQSIGAIQRLDGEILRTMELCKAKSEAACDSSLLKGSNDASIEAVVLLVEDNDQTRLGCQTLLESANQGDFVVLPCPDGAEALKVFGLRSEEISLVLLDINLPDHDGVDLFYQMRQERPDLKIVTMSGMPKQHLHGLFHADRPNGVLEKPFDANELLATVVDVLKDEG